MDQVPYITNLFYLSRSSVKFKQAIIRDLSNPDIVRQLRILGLIGKFFSGPWMIQFYGNEMDRRHLEMVPLMKDCVKFLESVSLDPSKLLTGNHILTTLGGNHYCITL